MCLSIQFIVIMMSIYYTSLWISLFSPWLTWLKCQSCTYHHHQHEVNDVNWSDTYLYFHCYSQKSRIFLNFLLLCILKSRDSDDRNHGYRHHTVCSDGHSSSFLSCISNSTFINPQIPYCSLPFSFLCLLTRNVFIKNNSWIWNSNSKIRKKLSECEDQVEKFDKKFLESIIDKTDKKVISNDEAYKSDNETHIFIVK